MLTILFFAHLREQLACEKLSLEISQPISVSLLRENLIDSNPHWAEFLANDNLLFSVNQTLVKSWCLAQDGDEVAFFPPVTGG